MKILLSSPKTPVLRRLPLFQWLLLRFLPVVGMSQDLSFLVVFSSFLSFVPLEVIVSDLYSDHLKKTQDKKRIIQKSQERKIVSCCAE